MSSRRKAEMVLELIDRATKPMRRFMRMQERMERGNTRASRMSAQATRLKERATRGLDRVQRGLNTRLQRVNQNLVLQRRHLRSAAAAMRSGATATGRAAVLAGGMMTAYAGTVSVAGAAMLAPSRQFERFETILTTTEGSAEAAGAAMSWVQDFAVSTPYELEKVTEAFVQLRSYGLDPTNGLLRTLGDTSAAMGKDIMQGVEAIADAVAGENERLKEFGIRASAAGDYFEYTYTLNGQSQTMKALASDRAAIEATLTEIFSTKFGGSMERLSQTFDGMLSNVGDQWVKFQRMIMDFGVFDWFKDKLRGVLDLLNEMEASGELEIWAKSIADSILFGLQAAWSFGEWMVSAWTTALPIIQRVAEALGGWRNMALALTAIMFRQTLLGAASGMWQLTRGAGAAALALGRMSFAMVAAKTLQFSRGMLAMLNPMALVRGALFALRLAFISTGIGALAVGLAIAGVWIYNNWAGLKEFFAGFGEVFMEGLGPARPAAEWLIASVRRIFGWIKRLTGPLDASAETWRGWGRAAGAAVGSVFSLVKGVIDTVWGWVTSAGNAVQSGWNAITGWFSGKINEIASEFDKGLIQGVFAILTDLNPFLGIMGKAVELFEYLTGWDLSEIFSDIVSSAPVSAALQSAKDFFEYVTGWSFDDVIQSIQNSFAEIDLFSSGVSMIQSLWDGAMSLVQSMVDAISAKLSGIIPDWMKDAWEWTTGGGEGSNTPAMVPSPAGVYVPPALSGNRAHGGPVEAGRYYRVGERGPEIIAAAANGYVIPNHRAFPTNPRMPSTQVRSGRSYSPQSSRSARDYVRASSSGASIRINAPLKVNMRGGNEQDQRKLQETLDEHRRSILRELEGRGRTENRRKHG